MRQTRSLFPLFKPVIRRLLLLVFRESVALNAISGQRAKGVEQSDSFRSSVSPRTSPPACLFQRSEMRERLAGNLSINIYYFTLLFWRRSNTSRERAGAGIHRRSQK